MTIALTWGNVEYDSGIVLGYSIIRQTATFTNEGKEYEVTFLRFYDKHMPQGERVTYEAEVFNPKTRRVSRALSVVMSRGEYLAQFKQNVRRWAEAL